MINHTEPKLKDFKCFKLPIDELPKCKELLILGNVYNFFGTYKDGDLSDFTQTPWSGEGATDNFMNFGQFVMNGGHTTIIASKETCNYYRTLYKEFYKAGFSTTHPKVVLFEIDDTKFLKGNFKIKDGKEEKLVKGEYFWSQNKEEKWEFNYPDFLKSFFENGEKRMFDLIIANPPYGKGGNLAKEISKAMLKAADIVVCLQPTSCSKYLLENLQFIENLGPIDNYFTTNAKGLGTKLSIFKMASTKQNIYKSFDDVILDDNEKEWCRVVKNYNEGKGCFARMLPYLYDKKDFPYEEDLIFEIANWLPYCGVAAKSCKSQDYRHNFLHQPIEWRHGNQQYGMLFSSKETVKNFTDWWYKWENTNEGPFTLLKLILSILNKVGNGDPSINKYPAYFPNLDWSRAWTDTEILKELGLPEDFLKEKV